MKSAVWVSSKLNPTFTLYSTTEIILRFERLGRRSGPGQNNWFLSHNCVMNSLNCLLYGQNKPFHSHTSTARWKRGHTHRAFQLTVLEFPVAAIFDVLPMIYTGINLHRSLNNVFIFCRCGSATDEPDGASSWAASTATVRWISATSTHILI